MLNLIYFDEPIDEVLSQYDFEIIEVLNESYKIKKGVWWVQTNDGLKILKKVPNSEENLKFILSAINHLLAKGVNIPLVNKTRNGHDYAVMEGNCFVLSDAIDGKTPSYNSQEELMAVVKGLAMFHNASTGFFVDEGYKPDNSLGKWVEEYDEQIEEMKTFYEKEKSSEEKPEIGRFIINEFPYFYEKAKENIQNLNSDEYRNWVAKIRKTGCICHHDFAAGNLLINSKGLYIFDLDDLSFDLPAKDIRKLFNKIMKKAGQFDHSLAKDIVDYYQSENPLTKDEWLVVKYDLMFPHLFIGAMKKYYLQSDKDWTTYKYFERLKEMADFEKTKVDLFKDYGFQ